MINETVHPALVKCYIIHRKKAGQFLKVGIIVLVFAFICVGSYPESGRAHLTGPPSSYVLFLTYSKKNLTFRSAIYSYLNQIADDVL